MRYEDDLAHVARLFERMERIEVVSTRTVRPCQRWMFALAARRVGARCGARVKLESEGSTVSATFFREDGER